MWFLYLGLIHLLLIIISLIFFMPENFLKNKIRIDRIFNLLRKHSQYLIIIIALVVIHLFEVNFIDSMITDRIGYNYAINMQQIEGNFVYSFSQNWIPGILHFFVLIYIAIYPFTLWFSPLYFILDDKEKSIKTLAYGLVIIYTIALPFYLLLPVTNVYIYYNVDSALETVFPNVENFFYSTTTQNNCIPSLHTAMTILIAYSVNLTENKRLTYFAYTVMIFVIISVIYLSIHWLTDVLTGIILSLVTIFLLKRYILN